MVSSEILKDWEQRLEAAGMPAELEPIDPLELPGLYLATQIPCEDPTFEEVAIRERDAVLSDSLATLNRNRSGKNGHTTHAGDIIALRYGLTLPTKDIMDRRRQRFQEGFQNWVDQYIIGSADLPIIDIAQKFGRNPSGVKLAIQRNLRRLGDPATFPKLHSIWQETTDQAETDPAITYDKQRVIEMFIRLKHYRSKVAEPIGSIALLERPAAWALFTIDKGFSHEYWRYYTSRGLYETKGEQMTRQVIDRLRVLQEMSRSIKAAHRAAGDETTVTLSKAEKARHKDALFYDYAFQALGKLAATDAEIQSHLEESSS